MSMKVFNLACRHDHRFEGWFASSAAFDDQQSRRLIECPICSDHEIVKMPAAPRLNLSQKPQKPDSREGRPQSVPPPAANGSPVEAGDGRTPIDPARLQAMFLQMVRRIMETTEDVGDRFAEEARRIHYSEAPERPIRGAATREEAAELREEGIDVVALPVPRALKEPLQ